MNSISGIIIGAALGFLFGFSYLNMNVKRGHWLTLFPVVTVIPTLAGAFTGGRIGYNIERSRKMDCALGLHKIHHVHIKVGRFWQSESTWRDCKGALHRLKTLKGDESIVSYLDGTHMQNHGNSASSVNITNYHNAARKEAFQKLREKHGDQLLQYLNQLPK